MELLVLLCALMALCTSHVRSYGNDEVSDDSAAMRAHKTEEIKQTEDSYQDIADRGIINKCPAKFMKIRKHGLYRIRGRPIMSSVCLKTKRNKFCKLPEPVIPPFGVCRNTVHKTKRLVQCPKCQQITAVIPFWVCRCVALFKG